MNYAHALLFWAVAFAAPAWAQSPPLLFDFSRVQHKPSEVTTPANQKVPAGTVELVDGQFGKACKFSFVASTGPQFFTAWINPTENWDQYEGFSFWVKGDGSKSYGGLEFIDGNDYSRMDRWMALAKKYGLTIPGDSYQGFDVAGVPTDHSRDCLARCEAAAREQYGISYEDLLRIVYGDLQRHARQQDWPPRRS